MAEMVVRVLVVRGVGLHSMRVRVSFFALVHTIFDLPYAPNFDRILGRGGLPLHYLNKQPSDLCRILT